MCRSAAEGGQRCHSAALEALTAAQAAEESAHREYSAQPSPAKAEALRAAQAHLVRTHEDFASTPTGRRKVQAMVADPASTPAAVEHGQRMLAVGQFLRERNAAVGAANADLAAGRPVFGGTGDWRTDWSVQAAVGLMVQDPDAFRTPPNPPLRKVKTYATVEEQQAGVAARARTLHGIAFAFADLHRQVAAGEGFDRALDDLTRQAGLDVAMWDESRAERVSQDAGLSSWRAERATETVLLAYRLAQARAQTPAA